MELIFYAIFVGTIIYVSTIAAQDNINQGQSQLAIINHLLLNSEGESSGSPLPATSEISWVEGDGISGASRDKW